MSIPVPLAELEAAVAEFGPSAFLMSAGPDGRPRINHVRVRAQGNVLRAPIGGRTRSALQAQPLVSCLWPSPQPGGLSLIADGQATVVATSEDDEQVEAVIEVTWAVRHRPPVG